MTTKVIASGGDDNMIRIWQRHTGEELQVLNGHDYIVWNLRINRGQLISFGYDCNVCIYDCDTEGVWNMTRYVKGPDDWADALATDDSGRYLTTHVEDTVIRIWDLEKGSRFVCEADYSRMMFRVETHILELKGHEIDVLCVRFALGLGLILSGSSDKTIRVWDFGSGACLKVLVGHSGKVWSLDSDRHRILSGGRHGEIRIWKLADVFQQSNNDCEASENESESVYKNSIKLETIHSSSTAIGQVILDRAMVVSADGLGEVVFSDFWSLQKK